MPSTYREFMDQIIRIFPDALIHALNEYHDFITRKLVIDEKQSESKRVYEYHNACKAIISHIELMLKLAKTLGLPDAKLPDHNGQIVMAGILQEAEDEVESFYASNALPDAGLGM